jgi:hypothetical protein
MKESSNGPSVRIANHHEAGVPFPTTETLAIMRNLAKPTGQKCVNDRSEKNDDRNKVERFPLNPPREFFEERWSLLVLVAIDRQRKIDHSPR